MKQKRYILKSEALILVGILFNFVDCFLYFIKKVIQ